MGSWKVVASIQTVCQISHETLVGARHTVKTTWDSLMNSFGNILSLEVDSNDLGTDGFGHSESSGNSVDCVNFGSSLE